MAQLDGSYWDSHKEFLIGLLLAGLGGMLFFTIGSTDVRYSLKGLREVHGRVIQAESHKPGRHSSYHLVVTLETANGPLRLSQQATGYYAQRLASGQDIRAWVDPTGDGATLPPSYAVWQIERGSQVVMPVMEVGDRVLNRLLWDAGSALIPLLGGLFLIGRHLVRYHDDGRKGEEEAKTA